MIVSYAMIFLMQAGFTLVECGAVRKKNSSGIIIKNMLDSCIGCITFWLVGFGFAFGDVEHNGFIGRDGDYFASSGFANAEDDLYLLFLF